MTTRPLYRHADLRRLFRPRSIAIVGATPNTKSFAGKTLENLRGFDGEVLLVNPKYPEMNGQRCYASLRELPASPDCVLIATGRDTVEPLLREAAEVGAGGVVLYASGFAETGKPQTVREQQELVRIAQDHGIRLLGPNCIGYVNLSVNANLSFVDVEPRKLPLPRHAIGVVSQSGALGFTLEQGMHHGLAFSHVLCSGNSCDVDIADQVAFLAEEPDCAAIACVFEGLSDPARLVEAAQLCASVGKPLVVYKLGRSPLGAAAALAHTGSVAGSHSAHSSAMRAAGVVQVAALDQLLETTLFLAKAPALPKSEGVIIVTSSGGAGIVAADAAQAHGVDLPQPREAAVEVIAAVIPDFGSARNPCDLTAQVGNNPEMIEKCAGVLLESDDYGAVVTPLIIAGEGRIDRYEVFSDLAQRHGKIACLLWMSAWDIELERAHAMPGLAVFRSVSNCFAALAAWHARARWLREQGTQPAAALES
ncbi:MAG: CoA-binding protein [Pseudomonadota bacterium]